MKTIKSFENFYNSMMEGLSNDNDNTVESNELDSFINELNELTESTEESLNEKFSGEFQTMIKTIEDLGKLNMPIEIEDVIDYTTVNFSGKKKVDNIIISIQINSMPVMIGIILKTGQMIVRLKHTTIIDKIRISDEDIQKTFEYHANYDFLKYYEQN